MQYRTIYCLHSSETPNRSGFYMGQIGGRMVIEKNERRKSKTHTAAKVNGNLELSKCQDGRGTGQFFCVENNGSCRWLQTVTINGRWPKIGLGSPPLVLLADARAKASKHKLMIRDGLGPMAEKNKNIPILNFVEAASLFLETKLEGLKSQRHKAQWPSALNRYANPIFEKLAVGDITVNNVSEVLKPIWTTKTETASRLRGCIEAILSRSLSCSHMITYQNAFRVI